MDNLPGDPSNKDSTHPPPFGSNFDPHTNPPDPNNPYAHLNQSSSHNNEVKDILQSEHAKHQKRDTQGKFVKSDYLNDSSNNASSHLTSDSSNLPPHPQSMIPPIIEVNHNVDPSEKTDPPLINFSLTNPVTYFKLFLKRLIKRQAITIRIPVLAIIVIMVGIAGFGVGFQSGMTWAVGRLFPNYSPILKRAITEQGVLQKSSKGEYYLQSNDKDKTQWILKSVSFNVKLDEYINKAVQIKGNLTPTPNLIEVSEVIPFDTYTQ